MLSDMVEIRWHGRGGQGAKTAALLLAESASAAGKYIQAFPEYGSERMGAPILAFTRISESPILVHCHVQNPQTVVVLDPTLLGKVNITDGVREDGKIIVNSAETPAEVRRKLNLEGCQVFTVDASQIALETIKRDIPNTPMMGAVLRVTGVLDFEFFMTQMETELKKKFATKPEVIAGNLEAIRRAYQEVKGE